MSILTGGLDVDDLDDWFKIGLQESRKEPTAIAKSALQGRLFNSAAGRPYTEEDHQKDVDASLPKFRKHRQAPNRLDYVAEYRRQYEEELLSSHAASIGGRVSPTASSVSDMMNKLELDSTVVGSTMPEDLLPEGATDVYKNYKFEHNYTELPVLSSKEMAISTMEPVFILVSVALNGKILGTIESNQVTILQGPTGTGKTTQVPQFILDHYAKEAKYCNIVVTQPRKIAAVSVSQRVCEERNWDVGSVCGYQVGLDRKASDDTRILYCTTGVLKEKFIGKKNMNEFTHVILDEVHERDIETDFLLLIVKKLLRSNSSHVKVILMSATFDTDAFAEYFAIPVRNHLEPAPIITVGSIKHHVSEFFADDLSGRLGQVPPVDENKPSVSEAMYDMVIGLIKEFDLLEEKEQGKDPKTNFASRRGSVLIFLPGLHEITEMCTRLKPLEDTHFVCPIPLHSSVTLFEQKKVFRSPKHGYRKIIVSTNIAESSITVPDIKYVVDFCLTKNLCCDPETNYTHLQLEWASKCNTVQRKGRAGRVSNGRVYFMVPRWFYNNVLPEFGIPEMQRSPLEALILKTKIFDMGEPKALLALALSSPNLEDIERTILSLKEVGALSSSVGEFSDPYDGDLTFVGYVLAGLPVDIRVGKLLILGHVFGVLEECIIIAAALSVKSIFARPFHSRLQAFKRKLSWSDNSLSDCIAIVNAYKVWDNRVKTQMFQRVGESERDWGLKSFIQIKTMQEVHKLVVELKQRLERFNILVPHQRPGFKKAHTHPGERLILKMVLCGAFYPNYAVKESADEMEAVKSLCSNDPRRTVLVKGLPMNEGVLYGNQIKDLFSVCWEGPPPSVSFGDSRAFVEFKGAFEGKQDGIHPGVYCALKMRFLRIPLMIEMLDRDESKKQLDELEKSTSLFQRKGELRTNRLRVESDVDTFDGGNNVSINPQISTLLVYVSEVIECGHFWGQCDEYQNKEQLQKINIALNRPEKPLEPLIHRAQIGSMVAAPYVDVAECFYRARIEKLSSERVVFADGKTRNITKAKVFFVDFGNSEEVHIDRLKQIPEGVQSIPFLATEFYLKEIRPSAISCADGIWSHHANQFCKQRILDKPFYANVFSVLDNIVRVELVEKAPTGREISINEELIQRGIADRAEESYLSLQNHEWRESQQRGEQSSQSDTWLQVNIPSMSGSHRKHRKSRKISLSGPSNPLEMSFTSTTLSGRHRVVKVDPDSINSVAVDENPQNTFSRLMVSAMLSLNSSGTTMIARDTTIMPQIPGLPAFVTLLFTPYAELRPNPKQNKYIGALCGLGFDDENRPILPDHDIELTFETSFDDEDINMINAVRKSINNALCTKARVFPWGIEHTVTNQEQTREILMKMLKKRREAVEPETYRKLYHWNQVNPDQLIPVSGFDDADALLSLHQPLALLQAHQPGMALEWKEYYVKHLAFLDEAVRSHRRVPVTCELCQITAPTSQILAVHMETERHLRKLKNLQEGIKP